MQFPGLALRKVAIHLQRRRYGVRFQTVRRSNRRVFDETKKNNLFLAVLKWPGQ